MKVLVKSNTPIVASFGNVIVNFAVNNPAEIDKEVAEKFCKDHPDKFKIIKKGDE